MESNEQFTRVSFTLTPAKKLELDQFARDNGMTRAEVIRAALRDYLPARDGGAQ